MPIACRFTSARHGHTRRLTRNMCHGARQGSGMLVGHDLLVAFVLVALVQGAQDPAGYVHVGFSSVLAESKQTTQHPFTWCQYFVEPATSMPHVGGLGQTQSTV